MGIRGVREPLEVADPRSQKETEGKPLTPSVPGAVAGDDGWRPKGGCRVAY